MNTRTPNRPATRTRRSRDLAATLAGAALVATALTAATAGAAGAAEDGAQERPRTERRALAEGRVVHNALQESWAEQVRYPARLTERFWDRSADRPSRDVTVRGYELREDEDTYRYCVVHRDGGWATFDNRDDRDARYPALVASGDSGPCRFPAPAEREPDAVDVLVTTTGLG